MELLLKVLPQKSQTTSLRGAEGFDEDRVLDLDLDDLDVLDTELERELDFDVTVSRSVRSTASGSGLSCDLALVLDDESLASLANKGEVGLSTLLEVLAEEPGLTMLALSLLSIPECRLSSECEEENSEEKEDPENVLLWRWAEPVLPA